jgi:hypothetical protein
MASPARCGRPGSFDLASQLVDDLALAAKPRDFEQVIVRAGGAELLLDLASAVSQPMVQVRDGVNHCASSWLDAAFSLANVRLRIRRRRPTMQGTEIRS